MGDAQVIDAMTGALHDPFGHGHMGITAENIAAKYGITREEQDAFCAREPPARRPGHRRGAFQEPDRAGRGEVEEGAGACSTPTSTCAAT